MQKKILAAALAVAGLSLSTVSLAGPGGTAGATSSLDSIVTLQINGAIRISQVADIPLGLYDGLGADLVGTSEACISRNVSGNYSVTVTSANGLFELVANPATATVTNIPYQVAWRTGANPYATLGYNSASGPYVADVNTIAPCIANDQKLQVTVPAAGMDAAEAGFYEDTLTVLVAPL